MGSTCSVDPDQDDASRWPPPLVAIVAAKGQQERTVYINHVCYLCAGQHAEEQKCSQMRAVSLPRIGGGRPPRRCLVRSRQGMPLCGRVAAGIEEDVDADLAKGRLIREREEFRCRCLGDDGRCLLTQQQLDALG
jgi:hypothetical protein